MSALIPPDLTVFLLYGLPLFFWSTMVAYSISKRESIRDHLGHLGLKRNHVPIRSLLAGVVISAVAMSGIFLVEWLAGFIRVSGAVLGVSFITPLPIMALEAVIEEVLSRGAVLGGLILAVHDWHRLPIWARRWLPIWIGALLTGVYHAGNPNASLLSVTGNALGGLMYGIAFVGSKRLWLPVGLHLAWNYVQGPISGFAVSGLEFGGLFIVQSVGPDWLTGGAYGPEAGLVGIIFRFVVIFLVFVGLAKLSGKRRRFADLDYFDGA